MEDAEGSADSEMSIITESLEYKMNNLRETWTGIAQDVFDRDDLGGFIDGLAAISEGLGGIIDNLGLLGTVATGLGGFLGFRNADNLFSFLSGNFVSGNTAKKNTKAVASNLLNAFDSFESGKGNGYAKLINTINETDFSKVTNELQTLKKQFDSGEISIGEFGAKIKEVQTNTVTLGDSIKNVLKSLGGAALTAGISAIASLAISSIVDAIDKWINRAQYAKEAMEQSFTEFEAAKEEYESINAEIETNKQEMAELEALGSSINSIEKERLSTLKQQTAELEMQAFYAKEKQDTEAQEALRDWENYFNETYYQPEGAGAVGAFLLELLGGLAGGTAAGYASSWANELFDEPVIDNAIKKYRELIEERDELIDQGAGNVDSKKWENITTQITAQEDVLRQYYSEVLEGLEYFDSLPEEIITENDKEMRDYLKDLRADISVILGGDEYKTTVFDTIIDDTDNLIDNLNMLKKVQGQTEVSTEMLLSAYPRLASAIADTGFTVDEFITYLNESILAEEKAAEEAANLGKTYEEVMENSGAFLDTLEALNGFEWTGFTGDSFSLEDFQSEDMQKLFVVSGQKALGEIEGIEADPKYWREYGQYIEMVNGRLVVNTDLLKENEEILKQQELDNISSALSDLETDYANNTRLINEYSDALRDANAEQVKVDGKWISQDTIDSLYEANSAISLQIDNLHLYAQAIKESSDAWNEWEAAQSSEDQGLYADESVNALNLINQTLNDTEFEDWRKTGTDQYAAALKLFLPEGTELDTTDLDAAQQLIDRIKKYYIAEYDEDTGLATYNKIDPYAVVTDMISAGYIESYMEGDQEKYRLTGEYTMKQIAEGMQLGLPFIEAVFGELSEYDIDFDWADEDPSQMFENLADAHQQWMDAVNKGDYETAHQLWLQMYEYADQIARSEDEIKKRLGFEGAENKYDVVSMYNQGMYNYGALSESGKKAALRRTMKNSVYPKKAYAVFLYNT